MYPLKDAEGRSYKELTMPTGITFRMYEEKPHVWVQVTPGESWFEPCLQAWERGDMKVEKKK